MLSYDEAIKLVLKNITPLPAIEKPLEDAGGLVLAETVSARWDLPTADNSAMDGFALHYESLPASRRLPVTGHTYAGHPFAGTIPAGAALRIMTGAPIPAGCDTVVPLEDVSEDAETICLNRELVRGQHVRHAGDEFRNGDLLLAAGTCLWAGEIGLLAAAGISRVRVHPAPRVAILSTGDELVELGEQPGPGQIINSNLHLLTARLREAGAEVIPLGIARDDIDDLDHRLQSGLQADLLLTSGGVSVGDKDQVQDAFIRLGFEKIFWKVAIKPGKPVLFGKIGNKPIFGLPGNPAASAATCEIFTIPALRRLAGHPDPLPPLLSAKLSRQVEGGGKRQAFLWGELQRKGNGYLFHPSIRQGSGQNRSLQGSCALLPIAAGAPDLEAGTRVEVLLMRLPRGRSYTE
ncbi:gephyrin-like molybdotransferase Glp [Geopsychrobacter electrodiphilus]|uniref:molybdopterin molybdotransferase MoeA n=1 Tax=Geopsychrobacter electrodiphilus TaxID=225196 RepID=UPI00037FBB44|nr:gephyrin-like molybdotransferase Glp [Geopsychrobacter electrodiphilus]